MASPAIVHPHIPSRRSTGNQWVAVLLSLVFICFTSTSFMGGSHTQVLLDAVWKTFLGNWHWEITGSVNEMMRKVGHFFGYGIVGLFFRNAWHTSIRAHVLAMTGRWSAMRWMLPASALSVASIFIVASLDEWHQKYVPGRVGSFRDVLIDTAGALLLNLVFWALRAWRNRRATSASKMDRGGSTACG